MTFYETRQGLAGRARPDLVAPISQYPSSSPPWFTLNTPSNQASATLSLPTNIEDAALEVYTSGHGCDEFWYAQESAAYEESIGQTCGGARLPRDRRLARWPARRHRAAVPVPVHGRIDPILWLPITGHDTLDIPPYRVDLSPWVGILTNGQPHTVGVSVYNNFGYWVADADLLLSLDHGSATTSGKLTHMVSGPKQFERVDEKHLTAAGGHATYTARHILRADGYVDTSHGRVRHHVDEEIVFSNYQRFNNTTETFFVNSKGASQTSLSGNGQTSTTVDTYPLMLNLTQQVNINQGFFETTNATVGRKVSTSYHQESITARTIKGKPTETSDHFILDSSDGSCFDQTLTASSGSLTSNTKSPHCGH